MGFVFYDTETTGTDTSFDQILQFAAIHTDFQFNEIERFEIRCQLLPHIVPAPGAMRVTKVRAAQLFDRLLHSHYEMVCKVREKLLAWSPAVFVGYNSLNFDEHLLRQAFYRTLHPAYLTNTNGNCRADALKIVQATSLFVPDALVFPAGDNDETVFKLDWVAPANGFAHERAHDALADVEATIFMCRLVAERAPDIWSVFMRFSQKAAVIEHISEEQIFCLSDFYFGKPYSWLVTVIGVNPAINSEFFVYDLSIDPETLIDLTEEQLADRLRRAPKPVRRLKANACPLIMSSDDAPPIAVATQLRAEELARRTEFLKANEDFRRVLISSFQSMREEPESSPHVEERIYDGFFSKSDEMLMAQFHTVPWEDRIAIVERFEDERLRRMGQRLIHCERPDLLPVLKRAEYERRIAERICGIGGETPWLTLAKALQEIEELLEQADLAEIELLREHKAHLFARLRAANEALENAGSRL